MTVHFQDGDQDSLDRFLAVVASASYKPGWNITAHHMERTSEHLAGSEGWTLTVSWEAVDSRPEMGGKLTNPCHYFAVPPASWGKEQWERWVLDCVLDCEKHEALELLLFDGHPVFYPSHGASGNSPYLIERRR